MSVFRISTLDSETPADDDYLFLELEGQPGEYVKITWANLKAFLDA